MNALLPYARASLAVALCMMLASCRAVETRPDQPDEPALLAHPTAEARAQVREAVGKALGNSNVLLADDALTHENTLIIEHARPRDPFGNPVMGRDRRLPERFRLVKAGGRCVLVHERTERRFPLSGVECAPVPSSPQ